MAVLNSTGIVFGDSTALNSKYGIIPQGSAVVFFLASAPTGWTQQGMGGVGRALRVVSGTGGGLGGSIEFLTAFPNTAIPISGPAPISTSAFLNDFTLGTANSPNHTHPLTNGNSGSFGNGPSPGLNTSGTSGPTGGGGSHNHGVPSSGSATVSTSVDFRVQYVDVISCTFN